MGVRGGSRIEREISVRLAKRHLVQRGSKLSRIKVSTDRHDAELPASSKNYGIKWKTTDTSRSDIHIILSQPDEEMSKYLKILY